MKKIIILLLGIFCFAACKQNTSGIPVIGFADAFEDNTLEQAKDGFIDALKQNGFDESKGTVKIIYRNAQGNIPTLTQIIKYYISQKVDLLATNPTISTITAVQSTKEIPIFMMVSSPPELMHVTDAQGNAPKNLFGAGDPLDYIDTSFLLMAKIVKPRSGKLNVGMIFNQSEPQSVNAIQRIQQLANANNINLVSLPVNNSADVQLVTGSLLSKNIDAFFANPDNTVFASFETIINACNKANVPVFTSEAGLVSRGAVAAYGADIYQWGFQAGEQAAQYLKTKSTNGLHWEIVKMRKHVYNAEAAKKFGLSIPGNFEAVK